MYYARPVARLVEELGKLPGVGPKTAQRLAFYLIGAPPDRAESLAQALIDARRQVFRCSICADLTDCEPCRICGDQGRDRGVICVVEEPRDVAALEKTHGYKGLYHVLHGSLSPMDGVGPQDLTIDRLIERVKEQDVREIIVATNASLEGETTALYLAKVLRPLGVTVSRLAFGLPVGADLEFADSRTLSRAIEGRRQV